MIKRQQISGIKRPREYSLAERKKIIEAYLSSGRSKREIWEKYTGRKEEKGDLLKWMRALGYLAKEKVLIGQEIKDFSIEQRRMLIEDYLQSVKTKTEIWLKYTGRTEGSNLMLYWMRQLGYENNHKSLI